MIAYESLQGPIERFISVELLKQEVNIKLAEQLPRASPFVANGNPRAQKSCLTAHCLFVFKKALPLALLRLIYCRDC